jgi:hypothetical protein
VNARLLAWLVLPIVLALSGCATTIGTGSPTRTAQLGPLRGGEPLVTLVVSEDPAVVRGECPLNFSHGGVLGCQTSRTVELSTGASVRVVKIVRFTDRLPSAMAFEIDIHELCHAVAALQGIDDPCHEGNDGIVQHPAALPRSLLLR